MKDKLIRQAKHDGYIREYWGQREFRKLNDELKKEYQYSGVNLFTIDQMIVDAEIWASEFELSDLQEV